MNMSARPRTSVTYSVPTVRPKWVSFSWENSRPVLNPAALEELDVRWKELHFTGAAIVHPLTDDLEHRVRPRRCEDRWLTLNVLLRVRGSVLLAEMPPLEDGDAVVNLAVTTDDIRLVRYAEDGDPDVAR
jgi:hypothetical protein